MRPAEVVAMQNDFVARYDADDGLLRIYIENVIASSWSVKEGSKDVSTKIAPDVAEALASAFRYGDTYHVTPDMTDLVEVAAARLDETDRIDFAMVPTKWGVVRFDKPLIIHDVRGIAAKAHWMTWTPSTQFTTNAFGQDIERAGLVVSWWNDTVDPDETSRTLTGKGSKFNPKVVRLLGRWVGLIGADHFADHSRLGPSHWRLTDEDLRHAAEMDAELVEAGFADAILPPPDPQALIDNTMRYMWAFFLLLDQEIVTSAPPRMRKTDVKFLQRMPIWNKVIVVDLRRRRSLARSDEHGTVNWSHRWMVRGHWRWQPYGDGTTRRIWIHPHIRGPEDKPIAATKKVYSLRR